MHQTANFDTQSMSSKRCRRKDLPPTPLPNKESAANGEQATFNNNTWRDDRCSGKAEIPRVSSSNAPTVTVVSSNSCYWIKAEESDDIDNCDGSTAINIKKKRKRCRKPKVHADDDDDEDDISISAATSSPEGEGEEEAEEGNFPVEKTIKSTKTKRTPPSRKGKTMSVFQSAKPRCKASKFRQKNPVTGKLDPAMTMKQAIAFVANLPEEEQLAYKQSPRAARSFRSKALRAKALIEYNSLTPQQRWQMMDKYFDDPQLANHDVDKVRIHFAKERGWMDVLTDMRQWMKARAELGLVTAEVVNYRAVNDRLQHAAFDHDHIMVTLREKLAAVDNDFSRLDLMQLATDLLVPITAVEKAIKLDGEFGAKYDEWQSRAVLEREIASEARRSLIIGYFLWQARGSYRERRNECLRYFKRASPRVYENLVYKTVDRFMVTGSVRSKNRLQEINWNRHYTDGRPVGQFIATRVLNLESDQQCFMRMVQDFQGEVDAGMQKYAGNKLNVPVNAATDNDAGDNNASSLPLSSSLSSSSLTDVVERLEKVEMENWQLRRRAARAEKALAAAAAATAAPADSAVNTVIFSGNSASDV